MIAGRELRTHCVIDDDFEAGERAQDRPNVFLRDNRPTARNLSPDERNVVCAGHSSL
jgi:hypothetical protein